LFDAAAAAAAAAAPAAAAAASNAASALTAFCFLLIWEKVAAMTATDRLSRRKDSSAMDARKKAKVSHDVLPSRMYLQAAA
jgi:hypothetical protein